MGDRTFRWPRRLPAGRYVKIVANAVGLVGSLDKTKIKDALAATTMPESIEAMKDGRITFSKDAREANFNLYRE